MQTGTLVARKSPVMKTIFSVHLFTRLEREKVEFLFVCTKTARDVGTLRHVDGDINLVLLKLMQYFNG